MLNNIQSIYVCSKCGAQSLKWNGRCFECGGWGTLKKEVDDKKSILKKESLSLGEADIIDLSKINDQDFNRIKTNIKEFDRVLGGGIVPGSLILLSGEPGIGKSTIVTQVIDSLKNQGAIYVSGEESASQVKGRFKRLGRDTEGVNFISEINAEKIIGSINKEKPKLVIVDSIQTVYSSLIPSEAGSISQIKACAISFLEIAKKSNISIILIGHITKDGQIAGPKSLEHIVDTVVYLESESVHNYRVLRTTKNRFGSVNELGVFEMTSSGFEEILNPGKIFLEEGSEKISGSVISCVIEGTRPFLVEIQALVAKTVFGYPQRKTSGFNLNRLQVLAAVLTKKTKINLNNQDIILNIAGGLKIDDPALDLAACLSVISSLLNQYIDRKTIVLGEVGLGGEIRSISKIDQRISEAEKLGFKEAIVPDCGLKTKKIKLIKVKNLEEVVRRLTNGV